MEIRACVFSGETTFSFKQKTDLYAASGWVGQILSPLVAKPEETEMVIAELMKV